VSANHAIGRVEIFVVHPGAVHRNGGIAQRVGGGAAGIDLEFLSLILPVVAILAGR
jgi:hypothetical protein